MMMRGLMGMLLVMGVTQILKGEVTHWKVVRREPYAEGASRGDRGPYERWTGRVGYSLDPDHAANRMIVDLPLAKRNAAGRVEFEADFEMLVPVDRGKANGAVFYEVNNRGNKTSTNIIDGNADDFLCRQGFVVLWSGWIAELLPGGGRLCLTAPFAELNGRRIRGLVRNELVVDQAVERASIAHRGNQGSYPPVTALLESATLSRREREADPRQPIPRSQWRLHVTSVVIGDQLSQLPLVELELKGGLQPGWIYEVIYQAEGALIQGAGLAAIRDIVSSLKYGDRANSNPLLKSDGSPLIDRALGFGTSQSGRCLREFLWAGFNADERDRQVFDGVLSHVAGGGLGSFNHRFASPTRTNAQHEEHGFPADYFPFAYGDERDPFTGQQDGILKRCRAANAVPKVFHTQSSSEYWHRSGSLVHTDPMGQRDSEIPDEVRVYAFGGTQHGPGKGLVGAKGNGSLPANPADYRPLMRGLVLALDAWVKQGTIPPPSVYPRIDQGTLVGWREKESGWQAIPGVEYPLVIQQPSYLWRGPDWEKHRWATVEPPEVKGDYVVRVPALGMDDNEVGTLNLPAISVPIGTYTSWNLRSAAVGAAGELLSLQGGFIPLVRSKVEQQAAGDPRLSLEERYQDFKTFQTRYRQAAEKLVAERYVLAEDLPRLLALAEQFRAHFGE